MRKIGFFLLHLVGVWAIPAYAADTTNGYIISIYGNALKSSYGECVHTAYYEAGVDSRAECGDQKEEASAPMPKVVVETVTISDADKVLFNFNAASLTSDGIAEISAFAKKLGAQPDITKITIDGYTDSI
jgi:outer membrane protein OmpA-like peptidoglycan-associated protein